MDLIVLRTTLMIGACCTLCILAIAPGGEAGEKAASNRIKLDDAVAILRPMLKVPKETPIPLRELTTSTIWDKLKIQVFQITRTDSLPEQPTFVMKAGKAIVIGEDFGGDGVNSLGIADLKVDGRPWLVYSYNWGSGVHRCQLGALQWHDEKPQVVVARQSLVMDFGHDWSVESPDGKIARVTGGGVTFGELTLTEKNGQAVLDLVLAKDLPEKIRKSVVTFDK